MIRKNILRSHSLSVISLLILVSGNGWGQGSPPQAARRYRQSHEFEIIEEFRELLEIPNVASDTANLRRNADLIKRMLEKRGLPTRLLEYEGAPPAVFAEMRTPGARETLTFYAHYDGQPVEPAKWVGNEPFRPTLKTGPPDGSGRVIPWPARGGAYDPESRIFARGSSDDKAPVIAILAALDALREGRITPRWNLKFFFEGEEEASSPHLEEIISRYGEVLASDLWLICDGPVEQNRKQQVYFGVRGVTSIDLTVYGASRELHSGHYGNWAPNPAMMLAQLLASMKDGDGRVLVDGFYDGIEPLGPVEKRALEDASPVDEQLRKELGIARTEGGGKRLIDLITLPSLNIRGMESGSVGATARNVVPASARATMDLRLVKGIDYRVQVDRVIKHIEKQGYHIIENDPDLETRSKYPKLIKVVRDSGYNAARTPMDLEISKRVVAAVESARGSTTKLPTLGGSVPLYIFTDILKKPTIGIPIANHDNNQHSANENLRIQNLWDAIETMAAILAMP
jgi:acetylornithine deacetylase/succinyl-diaminopimelate desuccinylase-like protein